MQTHPNFKKWLVLGCDYPLLQQADIQMLLEASKYYSNAAYFHEYYVPTLGIYDCSSLIVMQQFYQEGNFKMQHVLKALNTQKIIPENIKRIQSFDTPEDYSNTKT